MFEKLLQLDKELFLFINGLNNSFFDVIMYWLSHKFFWLPFYLIIASILIKEFKKKSLLIFLNIAILITLCDQTASKLIKPFVKRLRPSHEISLQNLVHLSEAGPGGKYGFVSSHAANVFGLTVFLILLLPRKYNFLKIVLVFWASLVSYSRIYNGVHYPLDILGGVIVGLIFGIIIKYLYTNLIRAYKRIFYYPILNSFY